MIKQKMHLNKPRDVLLAGSTGEGAANGDSNDDDDDDDDDDNGNGDGNGDGDRRDPWGQWQRGGGGEGGGSSSLVSSIGHRGHGEVSFPCALVRIPDYLRK
jgi:hypothetical protein